MRAMTTLLTAIFLTSGISPVLHASEQDYKIVRQEKSYLKNRLQTNNNRYGSFLCVLQLLKQNNAKILVEIGTARDGDTNFTWDGGSTIIFADWATDNDAVLYSVDIDPKAVEKAKEATLNYAANAHIICDDSLAFIEEFNLPIDFLYLDSYDYDIKDPEPSRQHHLKEIILAYPKLHDNSVVMIDDCDLPGGGKGVYVIKFLTDRGWKVVYDGYQVVLVKDV